MAVIGRRRRPRWLWPLVLRSRLSCSSSTWWCRPGPTCPPAVSPRWATSTRCAAEIDQSNQQGADVVDIRDNAAKLGRAGITRRLERVARDSERTLSSARSADPPADLSDAHSLLICHALAPRPGDDADEGSARRRARQGDGRGGVGHRAKMADAARTSSPPIATMPGSSRRSTPVTEAAARRCSHRRGGWTTSRAGRPQSWAAFIRALRSASKLAPVHDTTVILVTTDPAAVRIEDGRMVLPLTKSDRRAGDRRQRRQRARRELTVEVTLTPAVGKASEKDFVTLAPGQRSTVKLQRSGAGARSAGRAHGPHRRAPGRSHTRRQRRTLDLLVRQ